MPLPEIVSQPTRMLSQEIRSQRKLPVNFNMIPIGSLMLRTARRIVKSRGRRADDERPLAVDFQGQSANDLIREKLMAADPCMITRIGGTELKTILRHGNKRNKSWLRKMYDYINGTQGTSWLDEEIRFEMRYSSGFFPCTDEALRQFADRFLRDLTQTDVLGSWLNGEAELARCLARAKTVRLADLEPYFHRDPWSTTLSGRTVLVIHPFEASIRKQYEKRVVLFDDPRILPAFTLKTLKAVQSIGENPTGFETWFDALDWMCARVREIEFDVALIGAGAYGLPLAAYVKGLGKKAVHLGGATQLMFGIKGKRWDQRPEYQKLFNEHWTRPLAEETPAAIRLFDGAPAEAKGQPTRAYW
jgi:hypothetical protein